MIDSTKIHANISDLLRKWFSYPDLSEPTQEETTARQHLFEAISRLGQALAERSPLVLFFDDWHWADAASLDVLHYAALRWSEEQAPILVLLTLRQEALTESSDLQTWWARLKHDVPCEQVNLATASPPVMKPRASSPRGWRLPTSRLPGNWRRKWAGQMIYRARTGKVCMPAWAGRTN
jgi:hypothetical protein